MLLVCPGRKPMLLLTLELAGAMLPTKVPGFPNILMCLSVLAETTRCGRMLHRLPQETLLLANGRLWTTKTRVRPEKLDVRCIEELPSSMLVMLLVRRLRTNRLAQEVTSNGMLTTLRPFNMFNRLLCVIRLLEHIGGRVVVVAGVRVPMPMLLSIKVPSLLLVAVVRM